MMDKVYAFKEIHRILRRSGGRMIISDLVIDIQVAPTTVSNAVNLSRYIDFAPTKEHYIGSIRQAGFQNIEVVSEWL